MIDEIKNVEELIRALQEIKDKELPVYARGGYNGSFAHRRCRIRYSDKLKAITLEG